MLSLHEQIADRHADILAYSRGLEREAGAHIRGLSREVAAILAGVSLTGISRRQLNALIAEVARAVTGRYRVIGNGADKAVAAMMAATMPGLARLVGSRARKVPDIAELLVLGVPTSDTWGQSGDSVVRAVTRDIRLAAVSGLDQAAGVMEKGGVLARAEKSVQAMVQAEALSAETLMKNAVATETSQISGFRSSAMFDSKTCLTCATMDGELFDRNMVARDPRVRGVGAPVYHLHCRCVAIPELHEDGPGSAIPGPDGTVSRGMTFGEWIGRKSKRYQEAYFGPGRYALWKRGDITLNDLMNGQGKIVTLDELRAKYGGD